MGTRIVLFTSKYTVVGQLLICVQKVPAGSLLPGPSLPSGPRFAWPVGRVAGWQVSLMLTQFRLFFCSWFWWLTWPLFKAHNSFRNSFWEDFFVHFIRNIFCSCLNNEKFDFITIYDNKSQKIFTWGTWQLTDLPLI